MLTTCLTFFISYVIFLIYPVVGPRIYLDDIFYLPLVGPYFTPLAQKIVTKGGLFGGAMPSSHCAVALVAVWYLWPGNSNRLAPALICVVNHALYQHRLWPLSLRFRCCSRIGDWSNLAGSSAHSGRNGI